MQCLRWPWKQWTNLWLGWNLCLKCSFCLLNCHGLSVHIDANCYGLLWLWVSQDTRTEEREFRARAVAVVSKWWRAFVIPRSQGVGRIHMDISIHLLYMIIYDNMISMPYIIYNHICISNIICYTHMSLNAWNFSFRLRGIFWLGSSW